MGRNRTMWEDKPKRTGQKKRVFVAIPLPEMQVRELERVQEENATLTGLRWTPSKNLHITGYFIGGIWEDKVSGICKQLRAISETMQPFELQFECVCLAPSEKKARMIWARYNQSNEFASLVCRIQEAMVQFHVPDSSHKKPIPHITLARLKKPLHDRLLKRPTFQAMTDPFQVTGYELWESKLMPQGAEYSCLERFGLG